MIKNDTEVFSGQKILDTLKNDIDVYTSHTCFNEFFTCEFSPDSIVYENEAVNDLKQFINNTKLDDYKTSINGTMGAIELVKDEQLEHYGEFLIDLDDPVDIAYQVIYIRAENIFNDLLNRADLEQESPLNDANKRAFKQAINDLMKEGF